MNNYKLGSLFDGSGGFPLAGSLCGIEPVWAAEIEPYPIAVTRSRFPHMKHLGDISKINGAEIEPVDIITFGSPCQDLSVAGKRAGLKHTDNGDEETTRSGLFMEAVRIIKEMRNATNGKYPTYALWENVPGAFSSNKGEDFRIVCEELIKIVEPSATMPGVPQKGWNYADSYRGDGWSLAYRVLDAQYWGVPQRRRRIYLIADLRGGRAQEILFEREGLRGYFTKGRTPWQGASSNAQGGFGADDRTGEGFDGYNGDLTGDKSSTLGVNCGLASGRSGIIERGRQLDAVIAIDKESYTSGKGFNRAPGIAVGGPSATLQTSGTPHAVCYAVENHPADSRVNLDESGKVQTLTNRMGTGGGNVPMVMEPFCKSARARSADDATTWKHGEVANTLNTFDQGEARANELVVMKAEPNFIDVEMEVAVRKYEVDTDKLVKVLRDHKGNLSNKAIAEALNCPITQVEHWFRTDRCFAIPEPEVWFKLKELLGITTEEFDESIMTFEYKGGTYDMRNRIHMGQTAPTLTCGSGNNLHLLPTEPVICLQGNGIDRANGAGCNGKGWKEDIGYTLNTVDRPAVAMPVYTASKASFFMRATKNGSADTLVATDYKDPQLVAYDDSTHHYIVRRLTPTECARLQGFADHWGHIDRVKHFSTEEYEFWKEVRNTHAAINGKAVKDYTEKQMVTWYNKLHTDSSEYKMWGNGIALPTALYVLQGLTDALNSEDMLIEDWML